MAVDPSKLDSILREINKKYTDSIKHGNEFINPKRISTGSIELDAAMGGGGIPLGHMTRFWGGESSSKTMHALHVIANAQKQGYICAYYNVERQYDPAFAKKCGVDVDALIVVQGTIIEELATKCEALLGSVHIHVIDSATSAVSLDELNANVEDWRVGLAPRVWAKVYRRLNEQFNEDNAIISIDHARIDIKTGAEYAPGGKFMNHNSSMTVHFKKAGWLSYGSDDQLQDKIKKFDKGTSGQSEPDGIQVKARIDKSRVCRPFRTATRNLDLHRLEFDLPFEYAKLGKATGMIEARGAHYYLDGDKIAHGTSALHEYIRGDLTLQEDIRNAVNDGAHFDAVMEAEGNITEEEAAAAE